jgi:hypothetical protein
MKMEAGRSSEKLVTYCNTEDHQTRKPLLNSMSRLEGNYFFKIVNGFGKFV